MEGSQSPETSQGQLPEKQLEATTPAEVYENLFPGSAWKKLPPYNLSSIIPFGGVWESYWNTPKENEWAHRNSFRFPSKDSLSDVEGLRDTELTTDAKFHQSLVRDLLKDDETLGGMAVKTFKQYDVSPSSLLNGSKRVATEGTALVAGILDPDNKPRGLVFYRQGDIPRKRKTIETPTRQSIASQKLALNPL